MIEIFKQIHRFNNNVDLNEGEQFEFTLNKSNNTVNVHNENVQAVNKMEVGKSYKITVKKYMTEPATISFDFMSKWNDDKPMPFVIMQGEVVKETRGMYYMNLQAKAEKTSRCLCCGKPLTNKISMLYGLGPECGQHAYINPFDSEEELNEHLHEVQDKISQIKWSGWVIKSAIKEWEEI